MLRIKVSVGIRFSKNMKMSQKGKKKRKKKGKGEKATTLRERLILFSFLLANRFIRHTVLKRLLKKEPIRLRPNPQMREEAARAGVSRRASFWSATLILFWLHREQSVCECVCECASVWTSKGKKCLRLSLITKKEWNFLFIYFSWRNKVRMSVNDHLEGILSDFEGECCTGHAMKT